MKNENDKEVCQRSKHNQLPNRVVSVVGSVVCSHHRAGNGSVELGAEANAIQNSSSGGSNASHNDGIRRTSVWKEKRNRH